MWEVYENYESEPIHFSHSSQSQEELTQIFNSAVISSKISPDRELAHSQILDLLESPAFQEILSAVKRLANREQISLVESAETLIRTFRKMDRFWTDFLLKEGFEKLKSQLRN